MVIIKKYLNRKLYDTEKSKYVTISDIAEMIQNDIEIKVLDNKTSEDITNIIMAKVILKLENKKKEKGKKERKSNLKKIIKNPGDSISTYLNKTKDTIKIEIDKLVKKGEYEVSDILKNVQSLYDTSTNSIDMLSKRLDDKIKEFDDKIKDKVNVIYPINATKEIELLKEQVSKLEKRVQELENK